MQVSKDKQRDMINALTIDVEDYFQVTAFDRVVNRQDWDIYPSRVDQNTRRAMDLLDEFGLKATFFILGWVAERQPELVRDIARNGHEVACHGYGHHLVYHLEPSEFRGDIRRTKHILEDLTGQPVLGYRAPSYSITQKSMWALDVLMEEGFAYDSSIFPIVHDNYGVPGSQRFPYVTESAKGRLHEFPLTTLEVPLPGKKIALPIAGGGYLRLLPVRLIHWAMQRINQKEGQPTVLYFHPWEIDPEQPRIRASFKSRFRHYLNLDLTEDKLRHLFERLRFDTMANVLGVNGNRPGDGHGRGREAAQ